MQNPTSNEPHTQITNITRTACLQVQSVYRTTILNTTLIQVTVSVFSVTTLQISANDSEPHHVFWPPCKCLYTAPTTKSPSVPNDYTANLARSLTLCSQHLNVLSFYRSWSKYVYVRKIHCSTPLKLLKKQSNLVPLYAMWIANNSHHGFSSMHISTCLIHVFCGRLHANRLLLIANGAPSQIRDFRHTFGDGQTSCRIKTGTIF